MGALINSAYRITGNHEQAHRLGWKIAGMIATAATLRPVDEGDAGWSLALLSDSRGQAATQSVNHDRMPVLMSDPADFETWLSGSTEDAFKLARSYAAEQMRVVQFGTEREDLLKVA